MADQQPYYLQGHLLGACSCAWGCPCSFEARPTQGFCEGHYAWHIEEGHYQGTPLAGSTGYPLKAGHPLTAMAECTLASAPARLRQGRDVGERCCTEIWP